MFACLRGLVAQLDKASDYGSEDCGFEPHRGLIKNKKSYNRKETDINDHLVNNVYILKT